MKKSLIWAKNKLKSAQGMSLGEMLCAVLILTLVSGTMASTVGLAVRQYQQSMRKSEAQILCSTLETVLSNELAYTRYIDKIGNDWVFQSQHNIKVMLKLDNPTNDGYGQLILQDMDDPNSFESVLGRGAYTHGLLAKVETFEYDPNDFMFKVSISVGCDGQEYANRTFNVLNVNRTQVTT